jgi:integrase
MLPSSTNSPKPLIINGLGMKEQKSNRKSNKKVTDSASNFDAMDKKNFVIYSGNDDLSKVWLINYYDENGKRIQKKGGINRGRSVEERYKIAHQLIKKLCIENSPKAFNEKSSKSLKAQLDKAIAIQCIGKKAKTTGAYNTKSNAFIKWCHTEGVYNTEGVTIEVATKFIQYLIKIPLANSTTENYREKLKTLFDQINGIEKNPFRKIKAISYHCTPARPYQSHEIEKLRIHITENDPQLWFFILFIINCLIRPNSELRILKVGHIDFERELILIPPEISKNGKHQWVVIPDELMKAINSRNIKDYPPNYFLFSKLDTPGPSCVGYNYFYKRHRKVLEDLGFFRTGYNLYSYKHYGALTMVRNDVPLMEIKEQGRWSSLDQMTDYLKAFGVKDMKNIKKFKGV